MIWRSSLMGSVASSGTMAVRLASEHTRLRDVTGTQFGGVRWALRESGESHCPLSPPDQPLTREANGAEAIHLKRVSGHILEGLRGDLGPGGGSSCRPMLRVSEVLGT